MSTTKIGSDRLTVDVAAHGAELVSLADHQGRELLWNGDPIWWSGRSPLLFPIVGKVPNDRLQINGKPYEMPQHGFARTSIFELLEADASSCTFELKSNSESLRRYPFQFALRVGYCVAGPKLSVRACITNENGAPLPMSFGFHPAFRWPLPQDPRREAYEICFDTNETAPVRRTLDGLLVEERSASPVVDRALRLSDNLFKPGAIIFDALNSRSVTYGPRGAPALRVGFRDMPHLGIWTKPGAPFVCIEPWQGHAAPVGFSGELRDKPGIIALPAGRSAVYDMTIELMMS